MKSFGSYISKYLVSFVAFILILLFLNAVVFGLTFQKIVTEDYGDSSPQAMLEMTATAATPEQLSDEAVQMLRQNHIWAIYLNTDGQCYWSVDLPDNVPKNYTIQDVALFSKGYIEDYPVLFGTPMMGCWCWAIPQTATQTHQQLLFHCSTSTTPHLCAGDAWLGFAVPLFSLLLFQTQNHSQYRTDCVRCENFGRRKASFTSYQRRTIGNCKQCKQSFFHFE